MYKLETSKKTRRTLYPLLLGRKVTVAVKGYKWISGKLKEVSEYEILLETDNGLLLIPKSNILYIVVE